MNILGTEPSSVILSRTKWSKKMKIDAIKVPKQAKGKRDGVLSQQNEKLSSILNTDNFDALRILRINRSRPKSFSTFVLGDSLVHQQ